MTTDDEHFEQRIKIEIERRLNRRKELLETSRCLFIGVMKARGMRAEKAADEAVKCALLVISAVDETVIPGEKSKEHTWEQSRFYGPGAREERMRFSCMQCKVKFSIPVVDLATSPPSHFSYDSIQDTMKLARQGAGIPEECPGVQLEGNRSSSEGESWLNG